MEHDRIFEIRDQEEILPGDQIIYHKVGAYTMCLSPLFIKWFPDVYVKEERIYKVRDRWSADEYRSRSAKE
jgi:diaminopimelate decarboxylase